MVSEPLDAAALRAALTGRRFGRELSVLVETGSTNAVLRAAATAGAPDGAVVMAEHQTAGRGRAGRQWQSLPLRAVQLSALVRPGPALDAAPLLSLAAGLAATEAAETVAPKVRPVLKWPNDILVEGEKLGGVLVEGELRGGAFTHAVIGIGLNVSHSLGELPEGAVSLSQACGATVDRQRLVVALLVALEDRLRELDQPGLLLSAYRDRCVTLGQSVRVERPGGTLEGTAMDVSPSGALLVATEAGLETVAFGDVVHLRTADGGRA